MKSACINLKGVIKSQDKLHYNIVKTLHNITGCDILTFNKKTKKFSEFEKNIIKMNFQYSKWSELIEYYDKLLKEKKYDYIYCYFGILYKFDLKKLLDYVLIDDTHCINFILMKNVIQSLLFVYCALKNNIKIIYLMVDPQEMNLEETFFEYKELIKTFYILNKENLKYLPFYEHSLLNSFSSENLNKEKLFSFACTCQTDDRKYLFDIKEDLEKLGARIAFSTRSDTISQTQYYDELKISKYTLIIPSYDISTFSIIRFFEAISTKCLPLLYFKVNLTDLKNTFYDIYKIYNKYEDFLIIKDLKNLKIQLEKCENIREKIISEFLNCKSFKNLLDIENSKILFMEKLYEN